MESIRILLVQMPRMLRDILEEIFAREIDLESVGAVDRLHELLPAVDETRAEFLIWFLRNGELPPLCSELLAEYPRLKVVAVEEDGRRGFICQLLPQRRQIGEMWPERLTSAIRVASRVQPAYP